ncbi:16S rRNA (cytidine(1402)-2'-O)-methyltransferase [Bartonella sp. LJL80]
MSERHYIIGAHGYTASSLEPALYLVATPIGNLGDITLRALDVLAAADILACEDTRVTRVLLERYAIRHKPVIYQEHNAAEAGPRLIEAMLTGQSVALVSDAGTPLISDPGFKLVEEARKAGIKIIPIPGASAILAALIATGLPTDCFFFAGFLSSKRAQRKSRLEELCHIPASLIFYESPHRVCETLADMAEIFGAERRAALCRELTKKFETVDVSTLGELAERYGEQERVRGEIVLVVEQTIAKSLSSTPEEVDALLLQLAAELSTSKAAGEAAKMTGLRKQDLFQRLIALKG